MMTLEHDPMTFATARNRPVEPEDAAHEPVEGLVEAQAETDAQPQGIGAILVASETKGMAEMVSRALSQDHAVKVEQMNLSLIGLCEDETLALSEFDIIVLEIKAGVTEELDALRSLRARAPENTRFLAMTADALTLSFARQLMDAGVDEVLPLMDVRPELRHAQSLEGQVAGLGMQVAPPAHNGMIISIAQTRGGIGATTLALNLAALLSEPVSRKDPTPQARVALLDLDFQNGDAAASVDIEDNGVFIEQLRARGKMNRDFVTSAMTPYKDRFDVLPTPVEFAPFDAVTPEMVADLLAELRQLYDYIILGLPRAMVHWIEPVLTRTDHMLMLTDTSVTGMRQARRLIDFFTEDNPGLPLDMVITKHKKPSSLPKSLKEATKFLDKPLDIWVPCDNRGARKATDQGVPMAEVAKRSPAVKALKPVVEQVRAIQATPRRREG